MTHLLAASVPLPTLEGVGSLGDTSVLTTDAAASFIFSNIISTVLGVTTISAGLWFMFQIFSGAFQWLTSGGDKQALENARKRLTHAVIGLLLVVLAYALIGIVGLIIGLDILNFQKMFISI